MTTFCKIILHILCKLFSIIPVGFSGIFRLSDENSYKYLHTLSHAAAFRFFMAPPCYGNGKRYVSRGLNYFSRGIDNACRLCYIFIESKAAMKTRRKSKIPREGPPVVQGSRTPAFSDTTSEPFSGNAAPGAPVKAPMSGTVSVQPGWNRGIQNSLYPTPDLSGVGIFYTFSPNFKEVTIYGNRKSVHV